MASLMIAVDSSVALLLLLGLGVKGFRVVARRPCQPVSNGNLALRKMEKGIKPIVWFIVHSVMSCRETVERPLFRA